MSYLPDRVGPNGETADVKLAATLIETATYGILYGNRDERMQEAAGFWTGIQRLLQAKKIDSGIVDGLPGKRTLDALAKLVDNERTLLRKEQTFVVTATESSSEGAFEVTDEVDGVRFRLLERKP